MPRLVRKVLAARWGEQRPLYALFSEWNSAISRSLGRSLDVGRSLRSHTRLLHRQYDRLRRTSLHRESAESKAFATLCRSGWSIADSVQLEAGQGPIGDLVFGVLIFRQRLALL